MKKSNWGQRMIAATLVVSLVVGITPVVATEEVIEPVEQWVTEGGDPMLGVQSGVEKAKSEDAHQPRSREELLTLDSVILSENGTPVAVRPSMEDHISTEELEILFSEPTAVVYSAKERDPNQDLREQFGLTDAQIEQGVYLHGSMLAYTSQLADLAIKAEYMALTQDQVAALADLISWGYACPRALRAMAAKDFFGLTVDELKTAQAEEIEVAQKDTTSDQVEGTEAADDVDYLSEKLGLPRSLAARAMEITGQDAQVLAQEMSSAMAAAYPEPGDSDSNTSIEAIAVDDGTYYAPKEVLGQPYAYDQQGNFDVNINTGAYSYTETDLSIPGKNGLDLVLTRQFHSDRANVMDTMGSIADNGSAANRTAFKVYYRWYEMENTGSGYTVSRELTDHDLYTIPDATNRDMATTSCNFVLADYNSAIAMKEAMAENEGVRFPIKDRYGNQIIITLVAAITATNTVFEKNAFNVEQENTFYVDQFGLGHGWMLGFSHLRWVHQGYGDWDNWETHLQLTLSNGARYNITDGVSTSGNWIENYDYDDIAFRKCANNEYPNAVYGLYHKDGKVEYFNQAGQNIAIRDRFGNTITINYTMSGAQVKKVQITDTVNNSVVYEEIPLDSTQNYYLGTQRYNKLWRLSLNGAIIREYYSYQNSCTTYSGSKSSYTFLIGMKNENGEVTRYHSNPCKVYYNSFLQPASRTALKSNVSLYSNDGGNILVSMYRIDYPNGGQNQVYYGYDHAETLGYNGYRHYVRCTDVILMDSSGNEPWSTAQYTYGDFDGIDGHLAWDDSYQTKVEYQQSYILDDGSDITMLWRNYDLLYTFNTYHQNTNMAKTSYSSMPLLQDNIPKSDSSINRNQTHWLSQTTDYTYPNKRTPWPSSITAVYRDNISTQQMTRVERYTYDKKGNVLSYTKPNGQVETYTYDAAYSLPLTTTFKQDANTEIIVTNMLSTDKKSILSTVTESNKTPVSKTVYRYDSYGQLIGQDDYLDATQYVTTNYTYNYSIGSSPIQVSVSGVRTASGGYAASSPGFSNGTIARKQTYNKRGWIMTATDANGNTTTYTYDTVGRPTKVTHPDGTSLSYSYDVANNAITYTDEAGSRWKCTYGNSGKLLTVTDLTSNQVLQTNTYDQNDRLVKQVIYGNTTPNQTTYYRYDTDGRLIEQRSVDANGKSLYQELYEYQPGAGKTIKTITGDSTAPSVITTSYQDNMGNTVKAGIFRNGKEELDTFAYDYLGNQTQSKTAYSADQGCAYTTASTYDHAGRLLSVTDASGNTLSKTYDWMGNQLTQTAPKDQVTDPNKTKYPTTYTYDALGRLLRVETPIAAGHTGRTDYTYDPNGNVTQEKTLAGPKGNTTTARTTAYAYDSLNRVTQVQGNAKQDGVSGTSQYQYTKYTYDALGNIKTMSIGNDTNWETTQYTYDRYSRLLTQTDPLGQIQRYTYDLNGLLISKTDRRGITTTNTYDAMGRLTRSVAGSDSMSFTYTMTGQRATAVSNGQTTTYTYNSAGDLLKEVTPMGTKTMTYGIGGLRKTFIVTADGKTQLSNQYDYNKLGYLTEVTSGNVNAHYSYDSNGNLSNVTNGNGTTAAYTYNKANLVTEIKNKRSGTWISNYKYTYNSDGNQITKTNALNNDTTSYTYDGLNRLTKETQTGVGAFTNTYTYDDFNNRSQAALDGVATSYIYDANNRLLSTSGGNTATYTYDKQGNMTQATLTIGNTTRMLKYTYDGFNRLKIVSDNSNETVYTYDADGHRTSKTDSNGAEQYVWDGDQLVVAYNTSAKEATSYIRGLNLIASRTDEAITYYHYNAHGDVVQTTTAYGAAVHDYNYDAFGVEQNAAEGDANPFRYCGEQFDAETGNYYLRARYYTPGVGRFTQEDTHWNPGNMIYGDDPQKWNEYRGEDDLLGLHTYTYKPEFTAVAQAGNLYVYGLGNPIYYIDSSGKSAEAILEWGAGAAAVTSQLDSPAPGPGDVLGGIILGGAAVVAGGVWVYDTFFARTPNLPSWKKVHVDMEHIMSGHSSGGQRGGPNKDRFPWWMTEASILKAIEEAYKHAEKGGEMITSWTNGVEEVRQLFQGEGGGLTIQFWFNHTTSTIETAWPKW